MVNFLIIIFPRDYQLSQKLEKLYRKKASQKKGRKDKAVLPRGFRRVKVGFLGNMEITDVHNHRYPK